MDLDEDDFLAINKPLKRENTGHCLFCQKKISNSKKSREHVIADWLIQYLGIKELRISPTVYNPFLGKNTRERDFHSINNFKEGRICSSCNNGWMSKLEGLAKPILINLIGLNRSLSSLSEIESSILAQWAFKTAIVLNSASNFYKIVPLLHYDMIFKGELPTNLLVTATKHYPDRAYFHGEGTSWTGGNSKVPKDILRAGSQDSYKIVLQFDQLILLVAYWPLNGWHYNLTNFHHVIHKPKDMEVTYYERSPLLGTMFNSEGASFFLLLNLEVY